MIRMMFLGVAAIIVLNCFCLQIDSATAASKSRLETELKGLQTAWRRNPKSQRVLRRIKRLAPRVEKQLRSRLASGETSWPGGSAAEFIHDVFDKSRNVTETDKWRDLWLLRAVQQGNIVGDFSSTAWFFMLLYDASLRSPAIFKQALDLLDRTGASSCSRNVPQSVCELDVGGNVLRVLTAVQSGLELQAAAVSRLQSRADADKAKLFSLRTKLALGWWRDGSASYAERLMLKLEAARRELGGRIAPDILAAYHALRADIFETNLRFKRAKREFLEALEHLKRSKPRGNSLEMSYAATDLLADISLRYLRHGQCIGCPRDLEQAVRGFILMQWPGMSSRGGYQEALLYLLVRALPDRMFSNKERRAVALRASRVSFENASPGVRKIFERHKNLHDRAWMISLAHRLQALGYEKNARALVQLLKARSVREASRHWPSAFWGIVHGEMDTGVELPKLRDLARLAFLIGSRGHKVAEHASLLNLWSYFHKNFVQVPNPIDDGSRADFATTLVPAFVRLAELDFASGRRRNVVAYLEEAQRMVRAKLQREWRLGADRAAAAIRSLRPSLRTMTGIYLRLQRHLRPGDKAKVAGRAFKLMQTAALSDTAASLQVSMRRRMAERSDARKLLDERERLLVRLEQLKGMIGTTGLFTPLGARRQERTVVRRLAQVKSELARRGHLRDDEFLEGAQPIDLPTIGKTLRPGEKLLLVQTGQKGTGVILVDHRGRALTRWADLGRREMLRRVRAIRKGLILGRNGFAKFPVATAARLYKQLFGPLAPAISDTKRLITIIDGPLQSLPLGVLPTQPVDFDQLSAEEARARPVRWLARSTAVSLSPSVRTFLALRRSPRRRGTQIAFFGIGDPVLSPASTAKRSSDFDGLLLRGGIADVDRLRSLSALPETKAELAAIADALGRSNSLILTGKAATETAIKGVKLENYDVIAFATHGLVAGSAFDGSEPGLVLTPPQAGSATDDGFLTMNEVSRLRLNADFVILSACDTATSDGRPLADGLSGLARAFFVAGAKNILATHWQIPSLPAVEITTRTVKTAGGAQGARNWSDALHQAQRALMDKVGPAWFAHPASWGAFQVIGAD